MKIFLAILVLLMISVVISPVNALPASASASGNATAVTGPDPYNLKSTTPSTGSVNIKVEDDGNRWSHFQNNDKVDVTSNFSYNGSTYNVKVNRPMPVHPYGKYTTWSGVVLDAEMHGNTGIGTSRLPKVSPDIALWGFAIVRKDGKVISTSAPTHIMVLTKGPMRGITLEVATEDKSLNNVPDSYINIYWKQVKSVSLPKKQELTREIIGWAALLVLTIGFGYLAASKKLVS